MDKMLRLQNVSTRRKDKINSDEEERLRLGYETQSGFRYADYRGVKAHQTAQTQAGSVNVGKITRPRSGGSTSAGAAARIAINMASFSIPNVATGSAAKRLFPTQTTVVPIWTPSAGGTNA
jgi:hypothetical protein